MAVVGSDPGQPTRYALFLAQSGLGLPDDSANGYSREPFAADVSEGKNDPIYNAHSYHTKVPHLAIVPAILHYTEPGDLVLTLGAGNITQWAYALPGELDKLARE